MNINVRYIKIILLIICIFIHQLAGGAALAVGIWLIADRSSFTNLISKVDQSDILVS